MIPGKAIEAVVNINKGAGMGVDKCDANDFDGWLCTREEHDEGPCALVPATETSDGIPGGALEAATNAIYRSNPYLHIGVRRIAEGLARIALKAAAPHLMAAEQRETVIEWGAAFKQTGNIYNYYRTREDAQAFVDSMAEVDAEMVVMTREVLPQSASEWRAPDA